MMDLPQGATERLSLADPKRLGNPKLVLRGGGPDPVYHQAISGGGPGSALRGSPQAPARVRNRLPSRAARRSPADRYGRLPVGLPRTAGPPRPAGSRPEATAAW